MHECFIWILFWNDQHMFKKQLDQYLLCISIVKAFGGKTNDIDEQQQSTVRYILHLKCTNGNNCCL